MPDSSVDFDALSARYSSPGWAIVRWLLFVPAGLIVAFLAYIVSTVINSFGSGLPSGIVWLFAAGFSGAVGTLAASYVAPHLRLYAALSYVTVIAIGVWFGIGNSFTRTSETPVWYLILVSLVFLGASIYAAAMSLLLADEPTTWPALSRTIRWCLFLPAGVVSATVVFFIAIFMRGWVTNYAPIIDVESRFLLGLAFISVATAIAPVRKPVVAVLGALYVLPGAIGIVGGILRPVIIPLVEHASGRHIGVYQPTWEFVLESFAFLAAGAIPIVAVFRAKAPRTTASTSALQTATIA